VASGLRIRLIQLIIFAICLFAGKVSYAQCNGLDFSANLRKGCLPVVVKFKATGFAPGSTFQWNLQSGFVAGQDTISWAYAIAGIYKVQMIVTPPTGLACPAVVKDTYITVLPKPLPDMRFTPGPVVCDGSFPVYFGDSTPNITSREWIVEGHGFLTKKMSYTFAGRGTIPVTLTLTNGFGCQGIQTNNFTVDDSVPVDICGDFNANNPTNVVGFFTPYVGQLPASRQVVKYTWSFPGGTPASAVTTTPSQVQVTYPDYYAKNDVTLAIAMSDGCIYTCHRKGFVSPFLTPAFTLACNYQTVSAIGDLSDTGRHKYSFSFPDAPCVYIAGKDPKGAFLTYHPAGNYTASISYQYDGTPCRITVNFPRFLTVRGPISSFVSHDNQLCSLNDTVHLINQSDTTSAPGIKYTWYILDSNNCPPRDACGQAVPPLAKLIKKLGTSFGRDTSFSPSVFSGKFGRVFAVALVASSSNGCKDSFMQCHFITVAKPKADFPSDNVGCYGILDGVSIVSKPIPPDSKPAIYSYNWTIKERANPQDSITGGGSNGVFQVSKLGLYDVYLKVSNGHCSGDTFKKAALTVIGDSTGFYASPRAGCANPSFTTTLNVAKEYYYPHDPNNPTLYQWKTGPGEDVSLTFTNPHAKTTQAIITNPGCYDIILDVTTHIGDDSCKDEYLATNYICAGVPVNFQVGDLTCPGDTVPVINQSDQEAYGYRWSVDPPSLADILPNDTAKNISIVFNASDTCFTVKLSASKSIAGQTCMDTLTRNFICMPPLKTDFFTTTPNLYCAPIVARFYDPYHRGDSSQFPINYLWEFGDGDTLLTVSDSVTHVYTKLLLPDYFVKLTVFYPDGCDYSITKRIIHVVGPVPHFTMDTKMGCDSMTVQFKNTSTNISSFYFFYGDGTPILTQNPASHTYYIQDPALDSITYYPTLVETSDTVCRVYYKDTIKLYRTPKDSKITMDTATGCVPFTAHFHDISRGANSWRWDFDGDGKIDDSTHKNPLFTYKNPGKYRVKLIVGFTGGHCDYITYSDTIFATTGTHAGFVPSVSKFCGRRDIAFKITNQNSSNYLFNYGDGTADTNKIITHSYYFNPAIDSLDSVMFNPKIIAYNAGGCNDTFSTVITGFKLPIAGFISSAVSGCAPLKVHFTDTSTNGFGSEWDFDNNGLVDAFGKEVDWVFPPGLFTVKLRSFTINGCEDSVVKVNLIEVNDPPKTDFTVSDSVICYKNAVQFINNTEPSAMVKHWFWVTDDSALFDNKSTVKDPVFRFTVPGWHTVELTAIDDKGCLTTISKRVVFVDDTLHPPNTSLLNVSVNDTNSVSITWKKTAYLLFSSYRLNRLENGKPVKIYSSANINDTVFIENNTKINTSGLSYCYNIQTINSCDSLSYPSASHCTILLNETAFPGPVNVLNWTAYVGWQPVQYQIFRAGADGNIKMVASVDGKTLAYSDTALCDETYCYFVEAIKDIGGIISKSNITCLHPDYERMNKPLYLENVTDWNDNQVKIQWDTSGNKNLVSYVVDRYNPYTGWRYDYASTQNNYIIDNKVDISNVSYTYRVRAIDKCAYYSPPSNIGTSILLNQKIINDNIALSWNRYWNWNGGVQYYKLELQQKGSFL